MKTTFLLENVELLDDVACRSQKLRAPSLRGGPSPSKRGSSIAGHNEGHGVSLADEETILGHMDAFCNRIRQIMDVINTLSQYHRLYCQSSKFNV